MREMKDSGVPWIGEIPKGWKVLRNKNVFSCSKDIVGESFATTQLLSLTTKGVKRKSQDATGGKVPESFETYQLVRKQQMVMCLFDLDCSAVFSGLSPYDGMISPAYKVLDCIGVSPVFADYWFSFVFDNRKFKHYAKNLRYTLNYDEFAILPIVCPSIDQQQRIADFLDAKCTEIDSVLEKTWASIEEYKKLKQSVITEAVTKGIHGNRLLKDSGVEWIGEIPEDWKLVRLRFLSQIYTGNQDTQDNVPDGEYPFYVRSPFVERSNRWTFEGPAILMAGDGAGAGRVFHFVDGKYGCHQRVYSIQGIHGVSRRMLYFYLKELFYIMIETANSKSTVDSVRLDMLKDFPICIAPDEEQQEIAAYLDEKCAAIDSLIASKEALIAELEAYKKSLIYEYVTGKKEVPES